MAYLSHDAWEAQLQHKAPRAILDSYNRGYDAYQEENVPPPRRPPHIPTLGEASPPQPARTRRTLADSHDSASVDDIPEIDTLDAVSASPQYSSRLGRQASVVEGDDGDSFEESD